MPQQRALFFEGLCLQMDLSPKEHPPKIKRTALKEPPPPPKKKENLKRRKKQSSCFGFFTQPGAFPSASKGRGHPRWRRLHLGKCQKSVRIKGLTCEAFHASNKFRGLTLSKSRYGYGSKLNDQGTTGFSLWFHLLGLHVGYLFLIHSHMPEQGEFPCFARTPC